MRGGERGEGQGERGGAASREGQPTCYTERLEFEVHAVEYDETTEVIDLLYLLR